MNLSRPQEHSVMEVREVGDFWEVILNLGWTVETLQVCATEHEAIAFLGDLHNQAR